MFIYFGGTGEHGNLLERNNVPSTRASLTAHQLGAIRTGGPKLFARHPSLDETVLSLLCMQISHDYKGFLKYW